MKRLLIDNLRRRRIGCIKWNQSGCTALLAFTMKSRCAIAASDGRIRVNTLRPCSQLSGMITRQSSDDDE